MTELIPSTKHFISISDLQNNGLSHYKINKLVQEGELIKLSKKLYENVSFVGEESDFSITSSYVPKGVFCMMTAAQYYGLTTYIPDAIDLAIERSMKVSTLPEWPNIHLWFFPKTRYQLGTTEISDNTGSYRIYSVEKTVVDILYYRNKIGIEETKEILLNYLSRKDRNLNLLHRYAEELGCGKILRTYLEVLV